MLRIQQLKLSIEHKKEDLVKKSVKAAWNKAGGYHGTSSGKALFGCKKKG